MDHMKEIDAMDTAIRLERNVSEYIRGMDRYIEGIRSESKETASKKARSALYDSGVITRTGKVKKKIVSWE